MRDGVSLHLPTSVDEALLERHGLADVPDHLPDAITWAPPHPDDRLIDWRPPENPHRTNEGTLP